MDYQKITKLLGNIFDKLPRFITKKWIEVSDQSGGAYNINKQIRFKTSVLRSDLCDYNDAYIVVKGSVKGTVSAKIGDNNIRDKKNRPLAFENNVLFISCISKINDTLIKNAEDLHIVMSMYNLLGDSKNYSKTFGSLWNYYRDELSDETNDNSGINKDVVNSESFKYKTNITGSTYNFAATVTGYNAIKEGTKEVEIVVPLKYIGNF